MKYNSVALIQSTIAISLVEFVVIIQITIEKYITLNKRQADSL